MEMPVENVGEIAVVTLPGDHLDAGNSKDFKEAMNPILEAHQNMVFEMSQLQFVDSSGLVAILSCLRRLNARNGELKLCGMTKQVRVLFELVRMHRIFDIYNTREEALQAYEPSLSGGGADKQGEAGC